MEHSMYTKLTVEGLATLSTAALYAVPAAGQERSNTQEVQVRRGEMFGDRMTQPPLSGTTLRLDDNAAYGVRCNIIAMRAVQLAAGYCPSRVSYVASGNRNLGVTTADVDAVWSLTSLYPIVPSTIAGVRYTWANLDHAIQGGVNGRSP
jgi:hypothetical protein